jgi:hypothetical protein
MQALLGGAVGVRAPARHQPAVADGLLRHAGRRLGAAGVQHRRGCAQLRSQGHEPSARHVPGAARHGEHAHVGVQGADGERPWEDAAEELHIG